MNFLQALATLYGCVLFAEVFLHLNRDNPVRHLFLAFYAYMLCLSLQMSPHMPPVEMEPLSVTLANKLADHLSMCEHCFVSYMELRNHTRGEII
jgi:hypothetical protein